MATEAARFPRPCDANTAAMHLPRVQKTYCGAAALVLGAGSLGAGAAEPCSDDSTVTVIASSDTMVSFLGVWVMCSSTISLVAASVAAATAAAVAAAVAPFDGPAASGCSLDDSDVKMAVTYTHTTD